MDSRTPLTILLSAILLAGLASLTPSVRAPTITRATPSAADPASADFSISCNPASLTLLVGATGSSTCTVASTNSFAGRVTVTGFDDFQILKVNNTQVVTGSVTLSASGSASVNFQVGTSSTTSPFVYPIAISASNGTVFHTFVLETVVNPLGGPNFPDYSVGLSSSSLTIVHGNSGSSTITLTPVNGFTGPVLVNAALSPSQLGNPNETFAGGVRLNLANQTLIRLPGPAYTATLNVSTTATTPVGLYIVAITMTGGTSQPFVQHTATLSITVT